MIKFVTAEEAVKVIKSGDHIHLSSVASAPQCLIKAMCERGRAGELKDVHIHHLHRALFKAIIIPQLGNAAHMHGGIVGTPKVYRHFIWFFMI